AGARRWGGAAVRLGGRAEVCGISDGRGLPVLGGAAGVSVWGRIMRKAAALVDGPDLEDGLLYPSSDGKPMAETDFHVLAIRWLLDALEDVFKDQDDV